MPIPYIIFCPRLYTRSRHDVWLDYALHAVGLVARANFRVRIKILLSCLNFRGRFRQQIPHALSLFCGFIMPGCALLLKRFKRKSDRRTKKNTRAHAALKSPEHSLCMQRICMSGTCPDCMRLDLGTGEYKPSDEKSRTHVKNFGKLRKEYRLELRISIKPI